MSKPKPVKAKDCVIAFRASADVLRAIQERSTQEERSVSSWLRRVALDALRGAKSV